MPTILFLPLIVIVLYLIKYLLSDSLSLKRIRDNKDARVFLFEQDFDHINKRIKILTTNGIYKLHHISPNNIIISDKISAMDFGYIYSLSKAGSDITLKITHRYPITFFTKSEKVHKVHQLRSNHLDLL
jgi:hypothetical protein